MSNDRTSPGASRSPCDLDPDQPAAIRDYNRHAWNVSAQRSERWSRPLSDDDIAAIKASQQFDLLLTPTTPVAPAWLPKQWLGQRVLALAGGGGQQGPALAAAGADVTVFDLSDDQLNLDRELAAQHDLALRTVQGAAHDMHALTDQSFDVIVNPCSNCFFPELEPVWQECARVLRSGGSLLSGIMNPIGYQFAWDTPAGEAPRLVYPEPYSDLASLTPAERARFLHADQPVEFGHSLEAQLGGLLGAGFVLTGFAADRWTPAEPKDRFFPPFFMLAAQRLG